MSNARGWRRREDVLLEAQTLYYRIQKLGEWEKLAEKSGARRASPRAGGRVVTIEGPVDRPGWET